MQKATRPRRYAFRDNYLAAIIAAAFILCSLSSSAQIFGSNWGTGLRRGFFDSTLYFPTGCGAPSGIASLQSVGFGNGEKKRMAAIFADTCGHKVYWLDWSDTTWVKFGSGSGGSSAGSADSIRHIPVDTTGMQAGDTVRYFFYDKLSGTFKLRKISMPDVVGALGYAPLAATDTNSLSNRVNLKKDKSDSTGATSYVPRNQIDTMRDRIGGKMTNFGNAPGQVQFPFASIPAATGYQTGTTLIAPDSGFHYVDTGSGGSRGWKRIAGGSGGGGGSDTGIAVTPPLKITRAAGVRTIGGDSLLNKYNSDIYRFPDMRRIFYCAGISASGTPMTNYGIGNLDSSAQMFTTLNYFPLGGSKYGGLLYNSTIGTDSFTVKGPYMIAGGSSFWEGHASMHGRLHPNGVNGFKYDYPDSVGQFTWFMDSLTNVRCYNMNVGGQGSDEELLRFRRDVLGDSVSTTLDGRYGKTISAGHPLVYFNDGPGNDPYKIGMTVERTIENYKQMAQLCQDHGILFVVCNSPSGAGPSVAGELWLQRWNKFLDDGGLEPYGAVVYDLRGFWSDPAWNLGATTNGVHGNPARVNGTDFTHMTPATYRAIAIDMFQKCHIPKVTKVVFQSAIAPSSPIPNFNYISTFEFDGTSYTVHSPIDSFILSHPLGMDPRKVYDNGDTIPIRPTAATNVVGTSGTPYGVGNIYMVFDNTADGTVNTPYTRKTMGMEGATANKPIFEKVKIRALNNIGSDPEIIVSDNAGSYVTPSLWFHTTGSGPRLIVNNGTTVLDNSIISIGGSGGNVSLAVGGTIHANGTTTSSQINGIEIGGPSTAPSSLGNAITHANNRMLFQSGTGGQMGGDAFTYQWFQTTPTAVFLPGVNVPSKAVAYFGGPLGFGNASDGDSLWIQNHPLWVNQTSGVSYGYVGYNHHILKGISLRNLYAFNDWHENATTIFNSMKSDPGKVGIGDSIQNLRGSTILDIVDNLRGLGIPLLPTSGRDSIGYISAISITQGTGYTSPSISLTGAGTGARIGATGGGAAITAVILEKGKGYKPGTSTTCTVTGTAGSGASCTLTIHGPDVGTLIYNTTLDSLQIFTALNGWVSLGGGGTGGATNITVTRNATNVTIASSTGTSDNLAPADATHAGALDTARAKFIDSLKNRQVSNDQNVGAIGSGRELLVTRNDSLLHRTIIVNGQTPDTASNGTVLINTGANFAQIADGTVTNSAGNLSVLGTGRGSNTFAANSLVVGSRVTYKGFGVISTAGTAPTLSMSFANSSSNVSVSLSSLLTTSMSNVPMEWEGYAIVRSTGGSGSIQINGWVSIGGTKAYISGIVTFNTTASQTFDVFAQFGTASTSNTIVSYQNYITMTP